VIVYPRSQIQLILNNYIVSIVIYDIVNWSFSVVFFLSIQYFQYMRKFLFVIQIIVIDNMIVQ